MASNRLQNLLVCFVLGCVKIGAEAGTGLYMGPYFPSPLPQNITVHQDTVAYLPCTVKQLGDKSVSWVRQRDADILTVDRYTFVRDERLTVHYTADTETWTLVIKYVQERDAGSYECQISTEPKMSMLVHLNVIVPQVEVVGDVDKYVRKGSTARLECTVSSTVQLPDYIFWYHSGERLLEYDHPRVKISVSRRGGQGSEMSITSTLVITNALAEDDGNYTCLPSNLHSASTILHVLNDEHPAAMQTGAAMLTDPPSPWGIVFVVLLAFIFVHAHQNFTLVSHVPRSSGAVQLDQSPPELKLTFSSDTLGFQQDKPSSALVGDGSKSVCVDLLCSYLDQRPFSYAQEKRRIDEPFLNSNTRVRKQTSITQDTSTSCSFPCVMGSTSLESIFTDIPFKNPFKSSPQSLQITLVAIVCSCAYVLTYEIPSPSVSRIREYP